MEPTTDLPLSTRQESDSTPHQVFSPLIVDKLNRFLFWTNGNSCRQRLVPLIDRLGPTTAEFSAQEATIPMLSGWIQTTLKMNSMVISRQRYKLTWYKSTQQMRNRSRTDSSWVLELGMPPHLWPHFNTRFLKTWTVSKETIPPCLGSSRRSRSNLNWSRPHTPLSINAKTPPKDRHPSSTTNSKQTNFIQCVCRMQAKRQGQLPDCFLGKMPNQRTRNIRDSIQEWFAHLNISPL